MAPCNGTQQWHHVHSTIAHYNGTLQRHPAMAPNNGTQQWHHVHSTIAHYNGTLQWHPAMAPRPLNHSTLQWHPATSPSNGTQQWHPTMAPRPLNHSTLQWHPAMAPSNGTTSTAPCNGILVPCPMRKSGSSPSPPILEVRTPIAIAIWGKIGSPRYLFLSKISIRQLLKKKENKITYQHLVSNPGCLALSLLVADTHKGSGAGSLSGPASMLYTS